MTEFSSRLLVRCRSAELVRWEVAAAAAGLPVSAWVRRALDEQAATEAALAREESKWAAKLAAAPWLRAAGS